MLRKKLAGFLGILMVSVSVLAGCSDAKADKAVQVTEGKETQGQEAQKEKPSSSHFTRICRGELRKRQGRISRLHL